jgi:PE family
MSFVTAAPEEVQAAARNLAGIRSMLAQSSASAAAPTAGVVAAAEDQVSAAVAAMFGNFGQEYEVISAQTQAFHEQFVNLLNAGAAAYLSTEVANAEQNVLNAVSGPVRGLLGQSGGAVAAASGLVAERTAGLPPGADLAKLHQRDQHPDRHLPDGAGVTDDQGYSALRQPLRQPHRGAAGGAHARCTGGAVQRGGRLGIQRHSVRRPTAKWGPYRGDRHPHRWSGRRHQRLPQWPIDAASKFRHIRHARHGEPSLEWNSCSANRVHRVCKYRAWNGQGSRRRHTTQRPCDRPADLRARATRAGNRSRLTARGHGAEGPPCPTLRSDVGPTRNGSETVAKSLSSLSVSGQFTVTKKC